MSLLLSNQIIQGDALTTLKTLPSESVDMCMTSPPYWALRDYGHPDQLGLEPRFQDYIEKLVTIFDQVKRVLKQEGSCWVVIADHYDQNHCLCMIPEQFAFNMKQHDWLLISKIIWHKRHFKPLTVKNRFTLDYEFLYFFTKSQKYYFETPYEPWLKSSLDRYNRKFHGIKKQPPISGKIKRCVWTLDSSHIKIDHPAVYTEELCETPIKAGCPSNGIVLDPFFGAGTTGLAALKLGRNFIGIELNPEYCKIAQKRLEPYLLQERLPITEQTL